jgi:hypothetical protein
MIRRRARGVTVLVAWLSLATIACSTPISVSRVDPAIIQRSLDASAVANGKPSDATRTVLEEEGLIERVEDEPEAVRKALRAPARTWSPVTGMPFAFRHRGRSRAWTT